jgi:ribonuclease-3
MQLSKPVFVTTFERGGANSLFVVDVMIGEQKVSTGTGKSRKDAEQNGSRLALEFLGVPEEYIQ